MPQTADPDLTLPRADSEKAVGPIFGGLGGEGLVKPWPRRWHLGGLPAGFSWNPGARAQFNACYAAAGQVHHSARKARLVSMLERPLATDLRA